jgi:hypothetical protein
MPAPRGSSNRPVMDGQPFGASSPCRLGPGLNPGALRGSTSDANGHPSAQPSVIVVFVDHTACPWLRLLRRGFRHCFVAWRVGLLWLACEPLKDRIELEILDLPRDFDLARFYGEQGHHVLLGRRPPSAQRRRFALAPITCVTVIKRLLAIDAPLIWTPAQLYGHLRGPRCGFRLWPDGGVARPSTGPGPRDA